MEEQLFGVCDICGGESLHAGGDGFFYCSTCGSQSQQFQEQALDMLDTQFIGGVRRIGQSKAATAEKAYFGPPQQQHQHQHQISQSEKQQQQQQQEEEQESVSASALRQCYLEGLQKILQMQCEALVYRHGGNPLVCALVGPIWLRFVVSTCVLEDQWAAESVQVHEFKVEEARRKKAAARKAGEQGNERAADSYRVQTKRNTVEEEGRTRHGKKMSDVWLAVLKKRIPVVVTLAILFLACHVAREPVLPTDITRWSLEGTLPYLAAFNDLRKEALPIDARILFRPTHVVSAKKLELMAATVAKRVGLRLPPVNFHAIAKRFLEELGLPVAKLAVFVSRFFDWYTPSGLWISDDMDSLPSRVYVMAMLMIILKIMYGIDGQGYWEREDPVEISWKQRVGTVSCESIKKRGLEMPETGLNCDLGKAGTSQFVPSLNVDWANDKDGDWNGQALLIELAERWQVEKDRRFDYEKDLSTYLQYCQDVVFSGLKVSEEEAILCDQLQSMYQEEERKVFNSEKAGVILPVPSFAKESREEPSSSCCSEMSVMPSATPKQETPQLPTQDGVLNGSHFSHDEVDSLKPEKSQARHVTNCEGKGNLASNHLGDTIQELEDNGFVYVPPIRRKIPIDAYVRYARMKGESESRMCIHADHYILLRSCANLIGVHPKALQWCIFRVENGLKLMEDKIKNVLETEKSRREAVA